MAMSVHLLVVENDTTFNVRFQILRKTHTHTHTHTLHNLHCRLGHEGSLNAISSRIARNDGNEM